MLEGGECVEQGAGEGFGEEVIDHAMGERPRAEESIAQTIGLGEYAWGNQGQQVGVPRGGIHGRIIVVGNDRGNRCAW